MDAFLVLMAGMDVWIFDLVGLTANLRTLSVLRLLRLLRIFRLLRMFRELQVLLKGIGSTVQPLFWIAMLLSLFSYMVAIFLVLQVDSALRDESRKVSEEDREQLDETFGNVPKAMWALLQVVTMDDWANIAAPVIRHTGPHMNLVFLVFLLGASLGLMNLLIGVIVETTFEIAKNDLSRQHRARLKEEMVLYEALRRIFEFCDTDKSGTLSLAELQDGSHEQTVREALGRIDLNLSDLPAFFRMMDDDGSGEVEVAEMVSTVRRMRSHALTKDLLTTQSLCETMHKQLTQVLEVFGIEAVSWQPGNTKRSPRASPRGSPRGGRSPKGSPRGRSPRGGGGDAGGGSPGGAKQRAAGAAAGVGEQGGAAAAAADGLAALPPIPPPGGEGPRIIRVRS